MVWAQRAGLKVGFLSARTSPTTPHRAAQLGITLVHQGVSSKLDAYERILADERLSDDDVAYMGDDIVDLAVLARVGLSAAPADAVAEVRGARRTGSAAADGGDGAARELIELILRAQDRWDAHRRRRTLHEPTAAQRGSRHERLRPAARRAGRPAGRADDRQGLGALQAARRQVDRSPARARVAALHPRPELPRRQPDRSGHRGADAARPASTPTRSKCT